MHDVPITKEVCKKACELFGIDSLGLTKDDRRYLEILQNSFKGGPAGVRALASSLHEDPDTLEHVYEPYLLRLGFVERTAQGRVLTDDGRRYLLTV